MMSDPTSVVNLRLEVDDEEEEEEDEEDEDDLPPACLMSACLMPAPHTPLCMARVVLNSSFVLYSCAKVHPRHCDASALRIATCAA